MPCATLRHGGTIGRGLQSDWILPDDQRYISGRHAALDYKGGGYYIADISTNGVYINDESEPLGKGNFRRLFDGDRLPAWAASSSRLRSMKAKNSTSTCQRGCLRLTVICPRPTATWTRVSLEEAQRTGATLH